MKKLALLPLLLAPTMAFAAEDARPLVGDPLNGAKLYEKHCRSRYKATGTDLFHSADMALMTDAALYAKVSSGSCVTDEQKEGFDASKLSYLEMWDMVAFMRTLHMNLSDFFPEAARYIAKVYTIDEHGLKRIAEAAKPLREEQHSAAVFTFFDFDEEKGNLTFVPQDPIKLDQLKKDKKTGYLVFLPMKYQDFQGEVGIAMDAQGVVKKMFVHPDAKGAELLNTSLARFEGMGRLGQSEPFKVSGGKQMAELSDAIFPVYLRAMESVTMYIRDERERTWAD